MLATPRMMTDGRRAANGPELRPTGRGLALVAACSRDWGVVAGERGRTRVWAEVVPERAERIL
jgi:hypothetical protein